MLELANRKKGSRGMTESVHLPIVKDHGLRPRAHFGNAVVCGAFQPGAEDSAATTSHFGLSLYMNTQYATFRDDDGVWYNAQRVIEGELAAAAFVQRAGQPGIMPESSRSHEGMCRWTIGDGEHLTEGAKMHHQTEPGARNSEPLRLVQSAGRVIWDEGDLLSLTGQLTAAFQWYAPMPDYCAPGFLGHGLRENLMSKEVAGMVQSSRRRRCGGWGPGLGARAAVECEPEAGRGAAAAVRRVTRRGLACSRGGDLSAGGVEGAGVGRSRTRAEGAGR